MSCEKASPCWLINSAATSESFFRRISRFRKFENSADLFQHHYVACRILQYYLQYIELQVDRGEVLDREFRWNEK